MVSWDTRPMKKAVLIIGPLLLVLAVGWKAVTSARFAQFLADRQKQDLPVAEPFVNVHQETSVPLNTNTTNSNQPLNTNTSEEVLAPSEKNLAVPFTSQAPHANWDKDHGEFCEEASVLMVGRFLQGRKIEDKEEAETALQQIKQWEIEHLGKYLDTTAAETAEILRDIYELQVELVNEPTIERLEQALAAGHPIIVPAAGRQLGNPNFQRPGPLYHMLVLKGYTADGHFITNDPGTRKGADYVYKQSVIMDAIHDWNGGDVDHGQRVVLIVSP